MVLKLWPDEGFDLLWTCPTLAPCTRGRPQFYPRLFRFPLLDVRRNLNYWDSAASFAGEVDNPGKTYPRALFACVVLVVLCNGLPVLVGTGSAAVAAAAAEVTDGTGEGRWSLWVDGYFADVASAVAGRWLGVWVVMAAAAANIGLFEAEMSSDAFQLMGMVRPHTTRHQTPNNKEHIFFCFFPRFVFVAWKMKAHVDCIASPHRLRPRLDRLDRNSTRVVCPCCDSSIARSDSTANVSLLL